MSDFDSGGHWYKRDGEPFYTIIGTNGSERSVTLRDARKVGAVPSVTTVLNVLSKPALENWKVEQGVLAALTLPRDPNESDEEFLDRVLEDSRQQARVAAAIGTTIHDAIECKFKGYPVLEEYKQHADAVIEEIAKLYPGVEDWQAESSFAHPTGYGGKVDLHSPSTGIVIDFKTKDGDADLWKRVAYDQYIQLAAYQTGLELPEAECVNIFVSRTHPGTLKSHTWKVQDIQHGKEVFAHALKLWQTVKKYTPSWG